MQNKLRGFSLLELLTVLGIIAIISIIAWPCYEKYLVRAQREEAISMILRLASALERYNFTVATYRNVDLKTLHFPKQIANESYQLNIESASDTDFLISASPLGKQAQRDLGCGTLLLTANRTKLISGPGKVADCWSG